MARSHRIAGGHLQRCAIVAGFAMVDLVAHLGDSSRARLRVRHLVRVYLEPVALEPYLLSHGAIWRGGEVVCCKVRFRQKDDARLQIRFTQKLPEECLCVRIATTPCSDDCERVLAFQADKWQHRFSY